MLHRAMTRCFGCASGNSARATSPERRSPRLDTLAKLEHIMFAEFVQKLGALFVTTEEYQRNTYLASPIDLADLDNRMKNVETIVYPLRDYLSTARHHVSAF